MLRYVCLALVVGSVLLLATSPGSAEDAKEPNVVGKILKISNGPPKWITVETGRGVDGRESFLVLSRTKVKGELKVGCRIKAWVREDKNRDEDVADKVEVTDE